MRHKLNDGYSDDVIAVLRAQGSPLTTKIIVLLTAGATSLVEARQIALGADCVLRDPVRPEVISSYLTKYRSTPAFHGEGFSPPSQSSFGFCGAYVDPVKRTMIYNQGLAHLTPREVELSQHLACSTGVATYEALYSEILGRKYSGDTSNLRVLLGKLKQSARSVGLDVHGWIEVIPKMGYQYRRTASAAEEAAPKPQGSSSEPQ